MAGVLPAATTRNASHPPRRRATRDPAWVRYSIITFSLVFLGFFLFIPLIAIFTEALRGGIGAYFHSFNDRNAIEAIKLTLLVAAISVPLNLVFGLAASWCIAKFNFRGKNLLLTLIDLPFAISPVISGLVFVLLFGLQGWFGQWLRNVYYAYPSITWNGWIPSGVHLIHAHGYKVIFAVPGIVLATVFITFPFVARELIPLMQSQGTDEEEAALVLGAGGLKTFWHVTLPNVKWALLYGVILCNARAMGEFGAVSVVSGNILGKTSTLPLYVQSLWEGNNQVAAFAVASLLALLAMVTLVVKAIVERAK